MVGGFTCSFNCYPFFWNRSYLIAKNAYTFLCWAACICLLVSPVQTSLLCILLFSILSEYRTGSDILPIQRWCFIMQGLIQVHLVIACQFYCTSLTLGLVAWTDLVYKQHWKDSFTRIWVEFLLLLSSSHLRIVKVMLWGVYNWV